MLVPEDFTSLKPNNSDLNRVRKLCHELKKNKDPKGKIKAKDLSLEGARSF